MPRPTGSLVLNLPVVLVGLVTSALVVVTACDREPAIAPESTGPRIAVTVDGEGYHPARIPAPAGQPITLVFTRTTDQTCGQVLVFPDLSIRRELPLREPVAVTITPPRGELRFTCGMDMYRGAVVAQ